MKYILITITTFFILSCAGTKNEAPEYTHNELKTYFEQNEATQKDTQDN